MHFNFKKKFGQNFLQDKKIINDIVSSIDASEGDLVIEIGPGSGALTKCLALSGALVLAYEIDTELKKDLGILENDKVKIVFDDFLKRDIKEDIKDIKYNNLYIIGNLPYYITTPIVTKIIEEEIPLKVMVIMIQNEVADRFSARVGTRDYGSITVFLNYYFDVQKLLVVKRDKFYPVPNVDSAVIKFVKKEKLLEVDMKLFNKFVKDAFNFKRKNLRNNFKTYDQEKISSILNELGKSLDNRAEDLSYGDFVFLTNRYYEVD